MVRPERRVSLAGASPVRVSAGAPGSRPQSGGEILRAERGVKSPPRWRAKKRAATSSERCSLVRVSAERCWRGPSRSCHGEGNRQQSGAERLLDLSGVGASARFESEMRNRRDPSRQPGQAKTERIRRDAESARSREGVRGVRSTGEGAQDNALEGRDPALIELGRR